MKTAAPTTQTTVSLDAMIGRLGRWRVDFIQHLLDEDYWTAGLYRRSPEVGRRIERVSGCGATAAAALASAMSATAPTDPADTLPDLTRRLDAVRKAMARPLMARTRAAYRRQERDLEDRLARVMAEQRRQMEVK